MSSNNIAFATSKQVANAGVARATVANMRHIDVQEWRKQRLDDFQKREGGKAAAGRRIGYRDGAFVGQMLRGDRVISEKTVEAIESLPGYAGWFSQVEPVNAGRLEQQDSLTAIKATPMAKNAGSDILIPQYETGGSMGNGLLLADQPGVIKEWRVSERWAQENVHRVTSYANLAIVTGFGPSMQPLFNPGDPLLVDQGIKRADVDGIYFFRVGEEGFVKQLQRIPTADGLIYRAKSYNPLYDPFDITKHMDFEVFARVVKVWKSEEF